MVACLPDAAGQMALDHALAEAVWAGRRPPTARLYRWQTPALTIGRHQHPETLPCPAVRRYTGGRAVYHENELTLSLAVPAGHPLIRPTVTATYRAVAVPLFLALERLGLSPAPGPDTPGRDRFACFAAPSRGEAMVGSHKVAAIAQRLERQGLLVQASIPLAPPSTLPGAADSGILGLSGLLPGVTWQTLADAVCAALHDQLGARWVDAAPSAGERERASRLAATRYRPETGAEKPRKSAAFS